MTDVMFVKHAIELLDYEVNRVIPGLDIIYVWFSHIKHA